MQDYRRLAGLIAAPAALLLAAGTAHAQTVPDPAVSVAPGMASQDPVALFRAVCINGVARLSRKWAALSTYSAIPAPGKAALGHRDSDVPNPVYQIGGGNEYLILPAPAPGPAFANGCAVIWEGDALAKANAATADVPETIVVNANAAKGWTVLKALPRPANPEKTPDSR
jgi:hypothetical protein